VYNFTFKRGVNIVNKLDLIKLLLNEETKTNECSFDGSRIKIAILQRGWVYIGKYSENGDACKLENAYCIRRWGTEKGLGQLALEGKQDETVLDKAGIVQFHKLTTVALIDVDDKLWEKEIS